MFAGAVHDKEAEPSSGVTVRPVGAPGTARGVAVRAPDAELVSTPLTARICTVYAVPLVSDGIVMGEAVSTGESADQLPYDDPPFVDVRNS